MKRILLMLPILLAVSSAAQDAQPLHEERYIFDPKVESHGHVHASSLVEAPDGQLISVWYENALVEYPVPPYYMERQDKSSDVRLGGARMQKGATAWDKPFVMADTPGVSDNNPTLQIDQQNRLWLIYPTLLAVPEWAWGSGLLQYRISSDYSGPGVPKWETTNLLVPHVQGLEEVMQKSAARWQARLEQADEEAKTRLKAMMERQQERLKETIMHRVGWMPRAHPLIRKDGAFVLPLSNENFNVAAMAITKDGGQSWTYSNPVGEPGLTQPSLAQFEDGTIVAFFRNSGPENRIKRSESTDGGMNWGEVTNTELLHPGAGLEVIVLKNGHLLCVYNNVIESPRDQLAVSISDDRGKTWKWMRHIEKVEGKRFDYPSIIEAKDGTLHLTYSYNLETIKHVHFNEAWVQAGD